MHHQWQTDSPKALPTAAVPVTIPYLPYDLHQSAQPFHPPNLLPQLPQANQFDYHVTDRCVGESWSLPPPEPAPPYGLPLFGPQETLPFGQQHYTDQETSIQQRNPYAGYPTRQTGYQQSSPCIDGPDPYEQPRYFNAGPQPWQTGYPVPPPIPEPAPPYGHPPLVNGGFHTLPPPPCWDATDRCVASLQPPVQPDPDPPYDVHGYGLTELGPLRTAATNTLGPQTYSEYPAWQPDYQPTVVQQPLPQRPPSCWSPPRRHRLPTAPLPSADAAPPHAGDSRRPSRLHLLSSMNKAKYEFGEGDDPVIIAVHPSGDELVCSPSAGDCKLFELEVREDKIKLTSKELLLQGVGPQKCLAFSVEGTRFSTGGVDGCLRLFEWPKMRAILEEPRAHKSFQDMDFSLDSEFLATTSADGSAIIWNTSDGTPVTTLTRNSYEKIELCRFSKDGTKPFLFCSVQRGNKPLTVVYDISTWNKVGHKRLLRKPATIRSISLDGKYLALGSKDGEYKGTERSCTFDPGGDT